MTEPTRVLLVDDHPIIRQGLAQLFSLDPRYAPVQQAGNLADAKRALQESPPDVMVLDLSLGKESGLDLLRALRAEGSTLPVVVLSMYDESVYAERVLHAGAQAYLMKQTAAEQVVDAVQRVLRGEIVVSAAVQTQLLSRFGRSKATADPVSTLSDREIEVLQLMGRGLSTGEIADSLKRSVKTIETHRGALKTKLGLRSGLELVRFAAQWQPDRVMPEAESPAPEES